MDEDEFVSAVLSSLPETVSSRGVYSEVALKSRFTGVEKSARKVALVGEAGGSPLQHLLSLLASKIMVDKLEELGPDEDIKDVSQMELIRRARFCVENGDMGMALRYMNHLKA